MRFRVSIFSKYKVIHQMLEELFYLAEEKEFKNTRRLWRTVWSVPLLLRPAVLTLFPSFPQRMPSFQLNLNPLKEPLGFIKVLEWVE